MVGGTPNHLPAFMSRASPSPPGMEVLPLLTDLGLTPSEARIYLRLLEAPRERVTGLARAAGISRPRAYDVTGSLVRRGLARERNGMYKTFEAAPLEEAVATLLRAERARLAALEKRAGALLGAPVPKRRGRPAAALPPPQA